jgi:hypothetical protein
MKKGFNRIGRATIMGLAWAAVWAPVGALAGWLLVGELEPEHIGGPLYAGFVCGAIFAVVAGRAGGGGALDEMSLPRSGMVGALSGLVAGALWLTVVLLSDPPMWLFEGTVVGGLTALSAISGVASALLARTGRNGASARRA